MLLRLMILVAALGATPVVAQTSPPAEIAARSPQPSFLATVVGRRMRVGIVEGEVKKREDGSYKLPMFGGYSIILNIAADGSSIASVSNGVFKSPGAIRVTSNGIAFKSNVWKTYYFPADAGDIHFVAFMNGSLNYMRWAPKESGRFVSENSRAKIAVLLGFDPTVEAMDALIDGQGLPGGAIVHSDLVGGQAAPVSPTTKLIAAAARPSTPPPSQSSAIAASSPTVQMAGVAFAPRHALVVANAAYGAAFGRLANPVNDANAVAAALRRSGFTVTVVANGDQRTMKRAIAAFGQRLTAAGRGATGLFYYAGHGVQSRGVNYLVPVGANIDSEADVDIEAVAADGVLRQMEEAGAATSIVILDACRNLPIARSNRDGSRGLARMEAPNGSFVAYSTAPGSIAADGSGANSPFAAALVAEMAKPGQQIEITFKNVRRAVMQATGGKQTPWDSSSLVDSFVFVP